MAENVFIALKIMGQGMAGIFAAILLIMLVIMALCKIESAKKGRES